MTVRKKEKLFWCIRKEWEKLREIENPGEKKTWLRGGVTITGMRGYHKTEWGVAMVRNLQHSAIDQINGSGTKAFPPITIVQNRMEYTVNNNTCHNFTEHNTIIHSGTVGIKGKEKDVFSKKQILIWLDLQADLSKMERIDFTKPNKFEAIARLLQAINGKSKDSWMEELDKYKTKGLYHYSSQGELRQLINTITNISETARKAGYRELAKAADRKIRELEKMQA
ncbi:hypothetical protein [Niastella populi]|uniref:Uncharacterized protein n=1 Tax=Niastella populi TaxID=550983 RepID=A0A1V9EPZ0_9BACT|nr:hypothetical protein [Niastella populi]OQP47955.1 hypothetical protein A4R26_31640 [Niastella populi]